MKQNKWKQSITMNINQTQKDLNHNRRHGSILGDRDNVTVISEANWYYRCIINCSTGHYWMYIEGNKNEREVMV